MGWYVWDGKEERFVAAERPPRDPQLAEALKGLVIRLADAGDRGKIFEFRKEAIETEPDIWHPEEMDLDGFRRILEGWDPAAYPNDFVLVADLDGKIIGVLQLGISYRILENGPSAWVEDIFVLKRFRGYGVGSRLMESAKRLAVEKGCRSLNLLVDPDNLAGRSFYRHLGFEITDTGWAILKLDPAKAGGR